MLPTIIDRLLITTERLVLRPSDAGDARRATEIRADWDVSRMLLMAYFPPDEQGVHQWFAEHPREWANGLAYRFSVLLGGQMIGLVDIDGIAGDSGILGYWLEKGSWGRGYASEAASAALGFAFKTVGLRTIRAAHASDNVASGYVSRRLGFQQVDAVQRFSHSRRAEIMQHQYVLTSSL